ncbi:transporter substrate-binding domain-containing protein [Bythopirellula polymerisocia]|nr:transporter substrate-binding domain-containing protein [Bythopirellula polymerisocia]
MSPLRVQAQDTVVFPSRVIVATKEVPPFAMKNKDDDWSGISIDLLREINVEFQNEAEHDVTLDIREMSLNEMLAAVEAGEVELAAAAITVNYEREKRMDFTHTFFSSGLGIAVGTHQQIDSRAAILTAVLSKTFLRIVMGLFTALFISAIAVYYFERRQNKEQFGGGAIRGIGAGLWWAAVTLTTVGYGDKVPKTVPGKFIGLIWMFAGLFIIASFTAAVTSALTLTKLESRIAGPADLSRVNVATVEGSTSAQYLRARHITSYKYPDVGAALRALQNEACEAVVYDEPILRYEVYRQFSRDIIVLPVTFQRQDYAFALPSGSPLRERVNQVILRITGSPDWSDLLAGYLGEGVEL